MKPYQIPLHILEDIELNQYDNEGCHIDRGGDSICAGMNIDCSGIKCRDCFMNTPAGIVRRIGELISMDKRY